jgi:hypothetical protein
MSAAHLNQEPLEFMERHLRAATTLEKEVRKSLVRGARKRAPEIVDAVWSLVHAYTGQDA